MCIMNNTSTFLLVNGTGIVFVCLFVFICIVLEFFVIRCQEIKESVTTELLHITGILFLGEHKFCSLSSCIKKTK